MLTFLKTTVDDASADQRAKVGTLYFFLLAANAVVWIWAVVAFADRPTLLGTAFLAYVLGLRHAVDADHIAAIDNVVRKLMQEGKRPISAGLFFSLGHSLVVAIAVAVIVGTAFALQGRLHPFKIIGSIIGTGASAFFLLAIAAINLVILRHAWQSFRRARRGEPVGEQELNHLLSGRGFLAVNGPSGVLYTRNGSLHVSKSGELVTGDGYPVRATGGGSLAVTSGKPVEIDKDGTVRQDGATLGQLAVVDFKSTDSLKKQSGACFLNDDAKNPPVAAANVQVEQGQTEGSNVAVPEAAMRLVGVMRQFEMLQKAVLMGVDMNRKAIEEVAKVGS